MTTILPNPFMSLPTTKPATVRKPKKGARK